MKIITILIGILSALASVSAQDSGLPPDCENYLSQLWNNTFTTTVNSFHKQYLDTKVILADCTSGKRLTETMIESKGSTYIFKVKDYHNSKEITCTVDPKTHNFEMRELFNGLAFTNNSSPECFNYMQSYSEFLYCDAPPSLCPENFCNSGLGSDITCEKPGTREEAEDDEALSVGAIVGIAVGSFVFLVGVALLIYRYRKGKWPWQSLSKAEDVSPMMVVNNLIF